MRRRTGRISLYCESHAMFVSLQDLEVAQRQAAAIEAERKRKREASGLCFGQVAG